MLVALILVVSIGAIGALEDRADDKAESSEDRIGGPADNSYYASGSTGGSTGGSTTGGSSTPSATPSVSSIVGAPPPSNDPSGSGNKWIANASITVTDGTDVMVGVTVRGEWTIQGQGGATAVSCPTGTTGACSVQFPGIGDNRKIVVFTVLELEKDGVVTVPPDPKPSISVDCTTVTPAIC